jgi:hypothetical protein
MSNDPGAFEHPSNRGDNLGVSDYHAASQREWDQLMKMYPGSWQRSMRKIDRVRSGKHEYNLKE